MSAIKKNHADEKAFQRRSEVLKLGAPSDNTVEPATMKTVQLDAVAPKFEDKLHALLEDAEKDRIIPMSMSDGSGSIASHQL